MEFWRRQYDNGLGFGLSDAVFGNLGSNWIASLHGVIHRLHELVSNRAGWDGADHSIRRYSRMLLHGKGAILPSLPGERHWNIDIVRLIISLPSFLPSFDTVCWLLDNYPSHWVSYCGQHVHIQGPSGRWVAEGIESEHQKLRTWFCNEVCWLRCYAGKCKFLISLWRS